MADEEKEALKKYLYTLAAAHVTSPYPLQLGTVEQTREILEKGGFLGSEENIKDMVYDDMLNYFEGEPGNIIKGYEARDQTPVGIVTHPSPLDITSWLYAFPLVVQAAELTYQAFKPAEVSDAFMKKISIADFMGNVAGYECEERLKQLKGDDRSKEKSEYLGHTYSSSFTFDGNTWYNPLMKENNYRQKKGKSKTRKKSSKYEKPSSPIVNSVKIENKNEVYNNIPLENKPKESLEEIERKIKGYLV